jgi:hypothetical protein
VFVCYRTDLDEMGSDGEMVTRHRMPARAAAANPSRSSAGAVPSTLHFAEVIMNAVSSSSSEGGSEYSEDVDMRDPTVRVPDVGPSTDNGVQGDKAHESKTIGDKKRSKRHLAAVVKATQAAKAMGGGSQPIKTYATSFGRLLGEGWRFGISVSRDRARNASQSADQTSVPSTQGGVDASDEHPPVVNVEGSGGSGIGNKKAMQRPSLVEDADTATGAVQEVLWNAFSGQATRAAGKRMPNLSTVHALSEMARGSVQQDSPAAPDMTHKAATGVQTKEVVHDAGSTGVIADVMVRALQQLMGQDSLPSQARGTPGPVISPYRDMSRGYDRAGAYHGRVEPTHWNGGRDTISHYNESGLYGHTGEEMVSTRQDVWRGQYDKALAYPHRARQGQRDVNRARSGSHKRSHSVPNSGRRRQGQGQGRSLHVDSSEEESECGSAGRGDVRFRAGSRSSAARKRKARSVEGRPHRTSARREDMDPFLAGIMQDVADSEKRTEALACAVLQSSSEDISLSECESVPLQRLDDFMKRSSAATSAGTRKRSEWSDANGLDLEEFWYDSEVNGRSNSRKDIFRDKSKSLHKHNAYDRSSAAAPSAATTLLPRPLVSGMLPSGATIGALTLDPKSLLEDSDSDINTSSRGAPHSTSSRRASSAVSSEDETSVPFINKRVLPAPLHTSAGAMARGGNHPPPQNVRPRFLNLTAVSESERSVSSEAVGTSENDRSEVRRSRHKGRTNSQPDSDDGHSFSDSTRTSDSFVTLEDHYDDGHVSGLHNPKTRRKGTSMGRGFVDLEYTVDGPTYSDYEPSTPTLSLSPQSSVDVPNKGERSEDDVGASSSYDRGGNVRGSSGSESASYDSRDHIDHSSNNGHSSADDSSSADYGSCSVSGSSSDVLESSVESSEFGAGVAGVLRNIAEANRTKVYVDRSKLKLWRPNDKK